MSFAPRLRSSLFVIAIGLLGCGGSSVHHDGGLSDGGADLAGDGGNSCDTTLRLCPHLFTYTFTAGATQPDVVLTHPTEDPYNGDHPAANRMALEARVLAQAIGYPGEGEIIGAPPVFYFEPHQPEMSGFKPEVLLDITEVWDTKRKAMECLGAQQHLWDYYTDLAVRRGVQLKRNAGPNLGLAHKTMAEAYMRPYPQIAKELA